MGFVLWLQICESRASNQADVSEADLLLPFELANLEGDYREYQKTRRNN